MDEPAKTAATPDRRDERRATIERIVAAQTPQRRKRDVEILEALERWEG